MQVVTATSWDWSKNDGSVVITHDRKPTQPGGLADHEVPDAPVKTSVMLWNGSGFTEADRSFLEAENARAVSRLNKVAIESIAVESRKREVDPALLFAVITAESSGDPEAVSHAGAQGLMQLMPGTAERFGVTDAFDVSQNIRGGATYLRLLLDRYDGDVWRAVAAYNAGETRIDRGSIPAETRTFADRVVALWINQRMGQAK